MLNENSPYQTELRRAQLIAVALLLGILMFAAVAVILVGVPDVIDFNFKQPQGDLPLISLIMLGLAGINVVMAIVLPSLMTQNQVKAGETSPLGIWFTRFIVSYAICEGACFANLVAYIIEHQWWSLAVTGGVLLIMLVMFPTRSRLEEFVESHSDFPNSFNN